MNAIKLTFCQRPISWLLLFLAASFSGCHGIPGSFQRPEDAPAVSDVAGTFHLDGETLKVMREEGSYSKLKDTTLVLRLDGTAQMVNIPDWWGKFGGSNVGYFSGEGKWQVHQDIGSHEWGILLFMPNQYTGLDLIGRKPPFKIFTYIGDPDSGVTMTFVKVDDPPKDRKP